MKECLDNLFQSFVLCIKQFYVQSGISFKSHFNISLTFLPYLTLWGMYYYSQLMDEETETQELIFFFFFLVV